jgi:hypothetical protein
LNERKFIKKEEDSKDKLKLNHDKKIKRQVDNYSAEEDSSNYYNNLENFERSNLKTSYNINNPDSNTQIDNEYVNIKKKIPTEEKIKKMLDKMGWKGQGTSNFYQDLGNMSRE